MVHTVRRSLILSSLVVALGAVIPAEAQEKPFKIRGTGVGPLGLPLPQTGPRPLSATGTATHLGHYTGSGDIQTDSAVVDPVNGIITGEFGSGSPFVFIAADGSELVADFGRTDLGAAQPGSFRLQILEQLPGGGLRVVGIFTAEFVVRPNLSTGRFAGVTGSWIMVAVTEPFVLGSSDPVDFSWEGEGTLTFPRKAK